MKSLLNRINSMKFRDYILSTYFLTCCALSAIGQQEISAQDSNNLKLDQAVRYGRLENGFTYYIRHNNEPKNEIYLQMVIKAGTFHEDSLQTEYAHLLEHMVMTRTLHFPELKKHIQYLGGYSNASTAGLYTYYWARFSSENKNLQSDGLQILRDWSQGIDLNLTSIDVQRGAVLGELRTDNPYREWLSKVTETAIEQSSGFYRKNKEASAANIRNFNKDAFIRFFKEWYRPDLEAAIIVGDINVDSVEIEIKRLFADLKIPKVPKDADLSVKEHTIKLDGSNQYIFHVDTINPKRRLQIITKRPYPGYRPKTRDNFKNLLVQKVYQEILLARVDHLQQYRPLFTLAPSHQYASHQLYTMKISMNFREATLPKMKLEFMKSIAAFRSINSGFLEDELKNAKEMVRKTYSSNKHRDSEKLAKKYMHHFVLGSAAPAPELEKQLIHKLLDEINLSDLHKAAINYGDLSSNTNFLFFAGPDTVVPDSAMIQNWLSDVLTMEVKPFTPKPSISTLLDPIELPVSSPNAVKSNTKNQIDVTKVEFTNGIKLLLKPAGNSNFIKIHASRPNNVPLDNRLEYLAAALAPRAIQFAGVGSYSKFQLSEFTGDMDVQMIQKLEKDEQVIIGRSKSDRIEDFLQLLYLYTKQPRVDKVAFQVWKEREQMLIKRRHPNRNLFFTSAIDKIRFPEVHQPTIEDLNSLSMKSIYDAYHRWYTDLGGYTFVITGDFNVEELLPLLMKYLSVLPEGSSRDSIAGEGFAIPLKKINEIKHIENSSEADVFLYFPVIASTDTKTKILVSLLSNALNSRIKNRLRKGSYSPGAKGDLVDFKNGIYNFQIRFDAELGEHERLTRWALEEFRELRKNGVKKDWFTKNLNKRISNSDTRFNNSTFWYNYLSKKGRSGENMVTEILEYETFLKHFIKLEDLNKAAKELLCEKYLQKFIFLPQNAVPTSEIKSK